jgi:tetratricopeptide (TPR) repeat protein
VLADQGDLAGAAASGRRAVTLDPASAEAQANLGNILVQRRDYEEAAEAYRQALAADPGQPAARRGLVAGLRAAGAVAAAETACREALERAPADAALWNDLGRCLLALGRLEAAAEAFERALAFDPELADAYRNLALCGRLPSDGPAIARLAALTRRTGLPDEARATAGFALGKVLDADDRCDEAFAAYDQANKLYRRLRAAEGDRFDPAALAGQVDRLIATFDAARFAACAGWGDPSEAPVFILGLPRSGTSLVEQIAASHSRVFGAGELRVIGQAAARLGPPEDWTRDRVHALAGEERARLTARAPGADRIIDKLPDNIFQLGPIAALYPSARVIFCRRDPRDLGLSCYFQKFSAGALTFSYDLGDIGRRIRETERLAAHWRHVLPLRWIALDYETLVAEPEQESRRLIAFLGLDWEPACRDFHRTPRIVQTASAAQVRQPLNDRSIGRWRRYAPHLAPLLETLGSS